jgi:predicted N-acetyltransferase YhbS
MEKCEHKLQIIHASEKYASIISQIAYENLDAINSQYHSDETMQMAYRVCSEDSIRSQFSWKKILIAINEDEIVGTAALANFGRNGDTRWCVSNVFVKIEYQGLGIGFKLVKNVIDEAMKKFADKIEVPSSRSAIGFYKKCGFKESGLPIEDELTWMIQYLK